MNYTGILQQFFYFTETKIILTILIVHLTFYKTQNKIIFDSRSRDDPTIAWHVYGRRT